MSHRGCFRPGLILALILAFASTAIAAQWKEQVLYSFQGGASDGSDPAGGVVFDKAGNLYGATTGWGSDSCGPIANECGLVFELSPPTKKGDAWTETILYEFKGKDSNDASGPAGGVILDAAGNVYGTTAYGGTGDCVLLGTKAGCGTVYELSPPAKKGDPWTETLLYSFKSGNDGYFPWGTLTFDSKGNLYGSTQFGGGKGNTCNPYFQYCGTVFKLSPPKQKGGKWTEKVLHSFGGGADGANPNGGLIVDSTGTIYGTSPAGGNQGCKTDSGIGCGTAFELKPPAEKGGAWTEQILHRFSGGGDGADPDAGLTPAKDGSFYGPAAGGGKYNRGLIFRLTPQRSGAWTESLLYSFVGNQAGQNPGALTFGSDGNLYGGASGGQNFQGLIFRLNRPAHGKTWRLTVLYNFKRSDDGAGPDAGLIFDGVGNLYSTTVVGGDGTGCTNGCGTVFEVSPP